MSYMPASPSQTLERRESPKLRLVAELPAPGSRSARADAHPSDRQRARREASASAVLIAGGEADRRVAVAGELRAQLSAETSFAEATALWEVLNAAATSSLVVLAGDLDDVSAKSLMHMIGHRYPDLAVISLEAYPAVAERLEPLF
jgi:hypothetical protein